MSTTDSHTDAVIQAHDQFMTMNYGRYPVVMERGEGVRLWDAEGHEYLDLFAGFGGPILGHCHAAQYDAVDKQARQLWHVGNLFHTVPQTQFAERLHRHGFGKSFFCHSGADANEAAIKLARVYGRNNPGSAGPRYKIITTHRGFHGRTFGAMMATAQDKVHKGFEPLLEGFTYAPFNDYAAIEASVDDQTAAIMLEPIQGEGGVHLPEDDFLLKLRKLCNDRDLLLIVDEVWTGCGRTGKWFAHQHWLDASQAPDVMTLAKGVGGGLAVGVVHAGPKAESCFDYREQGGVVHATTLGGNCLSMAVASAIFDVIENDHLLEHATKLGEHAVDRLQHFAVDRPIVTNVRGKGLFIGVELDLTQSSLGFKDAGELVKHCLLEHRLVLNACQGNVVRIAPALVITQDELDQGLNILEQVLR